MPGVVHFKDDEFPFPKYHFDAIRKDSQVTIVPGEVTCRRCLAGMKKGEKVGGK